MTNTIQVPISQLQLDPSLQPRVGGLDESHVRELQECPDNWPPLVVVKQSGGYLLVDGFHRLAAAQNLELEAVPVEIVEPSPEDDLRSLAFLLNAIHGRALTLSDRREFARYLLQQYTALSDSEIGRRSGLAQQTIKTIRIELEAVGQIDRLDTRLGSDGKAYPAYVNQPKRQPGELPKPSVVDTFTDTMGKVFTPKERAQQRQIAHYLKRLSVALQEQDDLESLPPRCVAGGWKSAKDAADACVALFGRERTNELRETLGYTARNVLDVAIELGYEDE